MSESINFTPQTEDATNCFYNAIPEDTTRSLPSLMGGNSEWIWLILIAFLFMNGKNPFGGSDGKSSNTLILMVLAFVFLSNTTSHK
ncbi:MAG: hypothetical protein RR448_01275 [Niameybacter sp.]|uniref:hypothetical protein n=1 Tax=Niameybacter sp. TaxID=2033640 RepID=UPI002FCB0A2E